MCKSKMTLEQAMLLGMEAMNAWWEDVTMDPATGKDESVITVWKQKRRTQ